MRPSYDDPDDTCDEGEPDVWGAVHVEFGQVATVVDGKWVTVAKGEVEAARAKQLEAAE